MIKHTKHDTGQYFFQQEEAFYKDHLGPNPSISLWAFARHVYAVPHVKDACLVLQEQHEADIPLLLFCLWAARSYGVLPKSHQHDIHENARLWRTCCIQPLRHIRQQMKAINTMGNDNVNTWRTIRDQVKATELQAEKSVLVSLETYAKTVFTETLARPASIQCALDNIVQYLPQLLVKPESHRHLASILHALESRIQYDDILNNIHCYTST